MARSNLLVPAVVLSLATQAQGASVPLATVPYRPDGTAEKLISLPVSVDGAAPRWFVLDSGAPRSALDTRLAAELKLAPLEVTREGGTGHGTVAAGHPGPTRLGIGGVTLLVTDPLTLDLAGVPIQPTDRGLVGSELFTAFVVRVDPVRRTIALYNPSSFRPDMGSIKLPLHVDAEHRRFYVDAVLHVRPGLVVAHRLRVDTGSEDSVDDPIVAEAFKTTKTRLGNGLGSDFEGVSGIYDAVELGPFRFDHVWGPGGDLPAMGMELLRRFVVTYDAPHQAMYLRPTPALAEPVPPPS